MKNTPSVILRCGAPEPSVPNLALPSCQSLRPSTWPWRRHRTAWCAAVFRVDDFGVRVSGDQQAFQASGFHEALHRVEAVHIAWSSRGKYQMPRCGSAGRACPARWRRYGVAPSSSPFWVMTISASMDSRLRWGYWRTAHWPLRHTDPRFPGQHLQQECRTNLAQNKFFVLENFAPWA